jgi:hypothetical protein
VVACTVNGTFQWAVQLNTLIRIGQCGWIYLCVLDSVVKHINLYCAVVLNTIMSIGQDGWTR